MISKNPVTTLKGHFDGKHVVLDEPPPPDLAPDTPVRVIVESEAPQPADERPLFDRLLELAADDDELPADFAEQHDHYVKGTPRR